MAQYRSACFPGEAQPMFRVQQSYAGHMPDAESPQLMLGRIIRAQRKLAELPMRQLAATAGISNPYLSQIERGLRAPSEAVLNAIADSLQTSVDRLYQDAGFVEPDPQDGGGGPGDLQADIEAASELTTAQRKALVEIYRGFVDANTVRRSRGERQGD
jgi:transcriptional regulator with XRE-family HTH domain